MSGGFCNSSASSFMMTDSQDLSELSRTALSNETFTYEVNRLFSYGNSIHDLLSDAAQEIICSGALNVSIPKCPDAIMFTGFSTMLERLYVILMVTFFSTTLLFLVIVISVYCEDRLIKMENEPMKSKKEDHCSQGSNLLDPIACKSSCVAYRELKKKHTSDRSADGSKAPGWLETPALSHTNGNSHVQVLYKSGSSTGSGNDDDDNNFVSSRPHQVTHSEITLSNLSEL